MNDDFNTPEAMAVLFELAQVVNREQSGALAGQLKSLANVLGLLERAPEAFMQRATGADAEGLTPEQIEARIQERLAARKAKDFATSDRVRNELLEAGVVLEDTPQGTIWRRA
jgi:cysteinyl-tRNA synthetase